MTAQAHDLATDLLKLAKDEVQLDEDIATRDADRLTVAHDRARVHADEQAANTAAKDVVNADRVLTESVARVHAQERVLAAAQAAGDTEEIELAKFHLQGARVSEALARGHADRAHADFDKAVTTLKTDTAALHADQDKLAKDDAAVARDGREIARDEHQVNHDLGLPEDTPIDGAPPLDGHGGVVVAEPGPIIDDFPAPNPGPVVVDREGDPLDPAPAGGHGTPGTGGDFPVPVLAHDPAPVLAHDPDPGHSSQQPFDHPGREDGHPGTTGHGETGHASAHDASPTVPQAEPETPAEPSHESGAHVTHGTGSHEAAGHADAATDHTADTGHVDAAALHH